MFIPVLFPMLVPLGSKKFPKNMSVGTLTTINYLLMDCVPGKAPDQKHLLHINVEMNYT